MSNNEDKIVIATRTDDKGFDKCVKKIKNLSKINAVFKSYIICNKNEKVDNKIEAICDDEKPTRATAFNLVINKLNENKENKYHLLTFSKEVELHEENIERMIREVEEKKEIIVVGYRLMDNILSEEECEHFANKNNSTNFGIAYQIPWNTCALWNKEFVYGKDEKKLIFDEICEKDKNQLGELRVKVNGKILLTDYEGMEDGLAIASLVSKNKKLKFKLINERLPWRIDKDFKTVLNHKIKMARKNIVLSTFVDQEGYSIDKLMKAKILLN